MPLCQQCSKLHDCSASSSPISGGLLCQSFQWFLPTKRSIASQVTVHGLGTGMTVGYSSPGSPHSPRAAGTAGIAITPSLETEEEKVCLKTQTILTHSPFNCISELPNSVNWHLSGCCRLSGDITAVVDLAGRSCWHPS